MSETLDVLIIGAGLSGVGTACALKRQAPWARFTILEARGTLGGTWDLFRYPGFRADSDMFTLGYSFQPWTGSKAVASGADILDYLRRTAAEYGLDRDIRYQTKVVSANWDSHAGLWTVEAETPQGSTRFSARLLAVCAGYFRYDRAHAPQLAGLDAFRGKIVHPQFWPEGLDCAGQRVLIVGGGSTAVTLAPELARTADVTVLQRSPAYIFTRRSDAPLAGWLRRALPARLAHRILRETQALIWWALYRWMRRRPAQARAMLTGWTRKELGADVDLADFTPSYAPWDERLCMALDGDFFTAMREGRARVVTDPIDTFTPEGVRTASGRTLAADIVVLATGFEMNWMGGLAVKVDGVDVDLASRRIYKGCMYEGAPNLVSVFGYLNSSWTMKSELIAGYLCRLLNVMRKGGYASATPPFVQGEPRLPLIDFNAGYVRRALSGLPKQGMSEPWRMHQDYVADIRQLRFGRIDDGVLRLQRFPLPVERANGLAP